MGKQTYQSCLTCPEPKSKRIQTQTCLTGKPGLLPHLTLRVLPGGFLPSHPPQLAQNMGCRPYLSSFYAVSWALAVPLAHRVSVLAQHSFPAMWPHTRLLALRQGWGCHGDALPQACLAGPTSHWNVSEIPPFRPASKPPLPEGHSHQEQQENLFRSCPGFQFGKQMATTAKPPYAFYFPFPFRTILFSLCPTSCGGYKRRQSDRAGAQISVLPLPRHLTLDSSLGLDFLSFIRMIIIISMSLTFLRIKETY